MSNIDTSPGALRALANNEMGPELLPRALEALRAVADEKEAHGIRMTGPVAFVAHDADHPALESPLGLGGRELVSVEDEKMYKRECLTPLYAAPKAPAQPEQERQPLAFQYRDEQVAKGMQPFYAALRPKQPPAFQGVVTAEGEGVFCDECGPGGKEEERENWKHRALKAEALLRAERSSAAPQPPATPPGWRLVPVHATNFMVHAGIHANTGNTLDVWRAMLAAAPQPPAFQDYVTAEERERARDSERLGMDDAIRIARGCTDYSGGFRGTDKYEAYQAGIATVVAALEGAKDRGLSDTQIRALHGMGAAMAQERKGGA